MSFNFNHSLLDFLALSPEQKHDLQNKLTNELANLYEKYDKENRRGCLDEFINYYGFIILFEIFGGYGGFLGAMKKAGFARQYISDKKKEWRVKFSPEGKVKNGIKIS
jgi:hypothetical protein